MHRLHTNFSEPATHRMQIVRANGVLVRFVLNLLQTVGQRTIESVIKNDFAQLINHVIDSVDVAAGE